LGVQGCYSREIFENIGADLCDFVLFEEHKVIKYVTKNRRFSVTLSQVVRNLPSLPYRLRVICYLVKVLDRALRSDHFGIIHKGPPSTLSGKGALSQIRTKADKREEMFQCKQMSTFTQPVGQEDSVTTLVCQPYIQYTCIAQYLLFLYFF